VPRTFDLRSDTVTQPTAPMREAMAAAAVGDDCYHDDPSVLELEARVAARLGKEAAVFVPTGTMANQLAVHTHCRPGETIACPPGAHVQIHEDASAARISGVQLMPIGRVDGYTAAELEALLNEESCGWPRVAAVWVENTLGTAGGRIWPQDELAQIREVAARFERPVHLDGARLWNAHVASGTSLPELASIADTVNVCLSKGLGAPGGSLMVGDAATIERAWSLRHALGGGMRQAGILAAGGLYALDHHLARLGEDHARARKLAAGIEDLPCWQVRAPQTSMVTCVVADPWEAAEQLCAPLREAGVRCYPNVYREVRFVLHLGIDDEAVDEIITRIRATLGPLGQQA
jgi:threonine aldolase